MCYLFSEYGLCKTQREYWWYESSLASDGNWHHRGSTIRGKSGTWRHAQEIQDRISAHTHVVCC